jgi:hypothetical protein
MATSIAVTTRADALKTILNAGILAGALDIADAILYFGLRFGISAKTIFMHIASGLTGPHFVAHHPAGSAVLGFFLHFLIACCAAALFYLAARILPSIISRPYTFGILLGLIWYAFMYNIVIPLSAVPRNPNAKFSFPNFVNELLAHVFLVGIPIALMVRRSARFRLEGVPE